MKQEKTGRKILVRSRNSLALTSLSWQSLKGALLVSLRTIWTFSNGTIRLYRKVVGIFLTLPKLWCQEIISYAIIFVVCSVVYMPLATGFCFIKISKAIPYTQWYIKSRSTSQMKLVFYYILQIVPLPRPDRRPSDSGSESTTESEEESEVS